MWNDNANDDADSNTYCIKVKMSSSAAGARSPLSTAAYIQSLLVGHRTASSATARAHCICKGV